MYVKGGQDTGKTENLVINFSRQGKRKNVKNLIKTQGIRTGQGK